MLEDSGIRKDRRFTARLIFEVAREMDIHVYVNGRAVPSQNLISDQKLMSALLKIGLFSIGAQSFSSFEFESDDFKKQKNPMLHLPAALITFSLVYALRCFTNQDKNKIIEHAKKIEREFGPVHLDSILMSELASVTLGEENVDV